MPAACTSTTFPPSGSGTSSSDNGPPTSCSTTAFTGVPSAPGPVGLPLLEERGDALLSVLGVETRGERPDFTLVAPLVACVMEQRLDLAHRVRALLVEGLDVLRDPGFAIV